ncbi:MAG: TrmH family RNA methyltransferase, partial [Planctomycetota bacterium]|nr:TrmH family RNA methyltransferase [Planctomycetota bacterium]
DGYEPVSIEAGEASADLDDFSWPEKPCLVLGNEATGVSPLVLDACERRVSIPMCGVKESFNVAVAFGIAAHRAARALAPANPRVVFRG